MESLVDYWEFLTEKDFATIRWLLRHDASKKYPNDLHVAKLALLVDVPHLRVLAKRFAKPTSRWYAERWYAEPHDALKAFKDLRKHLSPNLAKAHRTRKNFTNLQRNTKGHAK